MPEKPRPLTQIALNQTAPRSYARDIDTYVRPSGREIARPVGESRAEQLARSLRTLSPIFEKYLSDREAAAREAAIAEGMRIQKENNFKSWDEYRRQHPEADKYNPYLREGFEKQLAVMRSIEYGRYMAELRETDPTYLQITDAAEADAYLRSKGAEWIKANTADLNDRAIREGFLNNVNQIDEYNTYQTTEKKLEELALARTEHFQSVISMGVENDLNNASYSAERVSESVSAYIETSINEGMNPREANDTAVNALISLMERKAKDGDLIAAAGVRRVLEGLKGHAGASLSNIARYRAAISEAWDNVGEEAYQQINRERQLRKWQKEDALEEVRDKYGAEVWANPSADYSGLLAGIARDYGSGTASDFQKDISTALNYQKSRNTYRKSLARSGVSDNAAIKNSLFALSTVRPLTDEESALYAQAGGTAVQVMSARYGKNVQDDGTRDKARSIATQLIGKDTADFNVEDYEKRRALSGEILADLAQFREDFHAQNNRLPSKHEEADFFDEWIIQYKRDKNEESQQRRAEEEKAEKIDSVITENNNSIVFKGIPQLTPETLQRMIDEERNNVATKETDEETIYIGEGEGTE